METCLKDGKVQRGQKLWALSPQHTLGPVAPAERPRAAAACLRALGRLVALGVQTREARAPPRARLARASEQRPGHGRAGRGQGGPVVPRLEVGGAVAVTVFLIGAGRRGGMFNS